jgi:hypothetical protein
MRPMRARGVRLFRRQRAERRGPSFRAGVPVHIFAGRIMHGFGQQARMRGTQALLQQAAQLVTAVGCENALHGERAHGAALGGGDEIARHALLLSAGSRRARRTLG